MRIIRVKIKPDCKIYLHGDTHEGNSASATGELDRFLNKVAREKNSYLVHMGDEIEATMIDHKYYDPLTTDEALPLFQMKNVVKRYKKVAKKTLVWMYGNHPRRLAKFGNLTQELCERLGVNFGTYSCKLILENAKTGALIGKMFLHHGFGSIKSNAKDFEQSNANKKANLKKKLVGKAADCIVMAIGHTHQLLCVDPAKKLIMLDDGEKLKQEYLQIANSSDSYIEPDRRIYLNTGSFVKTYIEGVDTYSDIAGYDPAEIGYCTVHIKDGKVVNADAVTL